MHFETLTHAATGETIGLELSMPGDAPPGLRIDSARGGLVRIATEDAPMLWARIAPHYAGVWLLRRSGSASPAILPPIRSREARAFTMDDWLRHVARGLAESERSPLGRGIWQFTELRAAPPTLRERARDALPDHYASLDPDGLPAPSYGLLASLTLPRVHFERWWVNGSASVFPLRDASEPDAARIKSWRKHARAGTLPPIVLWWVGALDMHLILDGHDRLAAAVAEGVRPRVPCLWQARTEVFDDQGTWREEWQRNYERAFAQESRLSPESREQLNQGLVNLFRGYRRPTTRARATPAMAERWREEVRVELANDPEGLHR